MRKTQSAGGATPPAPAATFKPAEAPKKASKLDDDFDFDFDFFEKELADKPKPKPAPAPAPKTFDPVPAPAPAPVAPAAVPATGYPSVATMGTGRSHFGSDDFADMDPVEAQENKIRMQKFANVQSFGSDDFFGRETEGGNDGIDYGDLRDKVADKFQVGLHVGKNLLGSGMDKLREYRASR
jgi:hypothetical protein